MCGIRKIGSQIKNGIANISLAANPGRGQSTPKHEKAREPKDRHANPEIEPQIQKHTRDPVKHHRKFKNYGGTLS
jgi:hypothetical protein